MNPQLATVLYVVGILVLFYLDREVRPKVTAALWIPTCWLLIIGSRSVSLWFETGPQASRMEQYTEGSPLDAAIFAVLILAGVTVLIRRSKLTRKFIRANLPILLYFAWAALSIAWSEYPLVSTKRWIKAIGDFVMVLVVLTEPDAPAAIRRLLARAAFILIPVSVLFIKYYPTLGRVYDRWTWQPFFCGVTTYKNLLGVSCLVCGFGSLWAFMEAWHDRTLVGRKRHLAAHAVLLAMLAYLFSIANSMTSLASFLLASAIIVSTWQHRTVARARVARLLMVGAVCLSLCALFVDPQTMLHSVGRDPTLTGRTIIWQAVLSLHTNPLIGAGFESFWMGDRLDAVANLTGGQHLQEAHNGYLEVYLNLGWIGVVLLAGVIVNGYRYAMDTFHRNQQLGRIRLTFLTAGIIYSMTEAGFRMLSPIWLTFLLGVTAIPCIPDITNRARTALPSARDEKKQMQTVGVF